MYLIHISKVNLMEFKYHNTDIEMRPGDKIKIGVGMFHKCNITATPEGKLLIYYEDGKILVI